MKTYLEIQVPLNFNDQWLEELRNALCDFPVRWQKGFYHITMAFFDETPDVVDLGPILDRHFKGAPAVVMTLDRLDVFRATSDMLIINLTSTNPPESFMSLTEAVRKDMAGAGCKIQSDFKLHVTLGRLKGPGIEMAEINKALGDMPKPSFNLTLTDVDFRVFRGEILYETKLKREKS